MCVNKCTRNLILRRCSANRQQYSTKLGCPRCKIAPAPAPPPPPSPSPCPTPAPAPQFTVSLCSCPTSVTVTTATHTPYLHQPSIYLLCTPTSTLHLTCMPPDLPSIPVDAKFTTVTIFNKISTKFQKEAIVIWRKTTAAGVLLTSPLPGVAKTCNSFNLGRNAAAASVHVSSSSCCCKLHNSLSLARNTTAAGVSLTPRLCLWQGLQQSQPGQETVSSTWAESNCC